MPPHCDSMDGPVVTAARRALDSGDPSVVLPYVHAEQEPELRDAFDHALRVRDLGPEAGEVAERWFFETAVRLHRVGEGAAFTGLKPAGLDVGPAIPAAERVLESGSPDPLVDVLCGIVRDQVERRTAEVLRLRDRTAAALPAAREYVEASLGLQVWAHHVYLQAIAEPHEGAGAA